MLLILLCSCLKQQFRLPAEPVATWDFKSGDTLSYISEGRQHIKLKPGKGTYPHFTRNKAIKFTALEFDGRSDWLYIESENAGKLDIRTGELSIVAVIKWNGQHNGFIAGMWDECENRRQYGLSISLPLRAGENKVCGQVSLKGGPTVPYPYSLSYSASRMAVPTIGWHLVAMTYDGEYIKSYLDGICRESVPVSDSTDTNAAWTNQGRNPYYYPDGIGHNGSDFTIGAVKLPGGSMGSYFNGAIRRISVFDRCLDAKEIIDFTIEEAILNE